MKTLNAVKKIVALGTSAVMLGATLMGATAYKLKDYPAPFVVNGVPAANLAVVVGDLAEGSDVVGAIDIIQALQAAAVVKVPIPGAVPKVELVGERVEVATPTDLLELDEPIGDVKEIYSEVDLPTLLKSSIVTTKKGSTKVSQFLVFDRNTSPRIKFAKNEYDEIGDFLYHDELAKLFEYKVEFEEGLRSDIETVAGVLRARDMIDREFEMLGLSYVFNDVRLNAAGNQITRIDLVGGPVSDVLSEGDKKTYTIDGKEYELEVVIIDETEKQVLLKVNGKALPKLKSGDIEPLPGEKKLIAIRDIIVTGKDIQKSIVRFYLWASKIEFRDGESAIIDGETIEDSNVKISSSLGAPGEIILNSITYSLKTDPILGNLFVPPKKGVREFLDEPEGLLSPFWDIRYEGLFSPGETTVDMVAVGREEYRLVFTNQEGLKYDVPLLTVEDGGVLKYGEVSGGSYRELHIKEPDNALDFKINERDMFILSDYDAETTVDYDSNSGQVTLKGVVTDNTAFTRVLRFEELDTSNKVVKMTDFAAGRKDASYSAGSAVTGGSFVIAGTEYAFTVDETNKKIAVQMDLDPGAAPLDLNNLTTFDQRINDNRASIFIEGGGIITLSDILGGGDNVTLRLNTVAKQFDEISGSETIKWMAKKKDVTGETVISLPAGEVDPGLLTKPDEPEKKLGLSKYGVRISFFDPSGETIPEEITFNYPLTQRGGQVFITSGKVERVAAAEAEAEKVQPIQLGAAKLASEIADVTAYNAIIVGGPCANALAAQLMGFPEPCWEAVPENKAIIQLYTHANGNVALLVAGRTALNTRQAARAVATSQLSTIDATKATVSGTTLVDITVTPA